MLSGPIVLSGTDIYSNDARKQHNLGAVGMDKYGGLYRYTKVAGDESAGYLLCSKADEANHQNIAVQTAASVGDTRIYLTHGGTAVDANEYDDGFLSFVDTSPEGEGYHITAHQAVAAGVTTFWVDLERPLLTAATTSSEVALTHSPWNEPDTTTTLTYIPSGVLMVDVDQSEKPYTWLKTRGPAAVLGDTTGVTDGSYCTISNQSAGGVGLPTEASFADNGESLIGKAMDASVAGEFFPVYLLID